MKKRIRMMVVAGLICVCAMFSVVLADPGTDGDPLISLSYIENVLMSRIEQYVESRLAGLSAGGASDTFKVVEAKTGREIICSAGTELILRMGSADIIATEKGGLADTTIGNDLLNGYDMPPNHLLIVPMGDGRGVRARTDMIVLIKGGYTIK